MPPHIFAAGQQAYRNMMVTRGDQSLILMGLSGSGKTFNARYLLRYLTTVGQQDRATVSSEWIGHSVLYARVVVVHVCMCYVYVCMHVHVCVCVHVCMSMSVCVCMCACPCVLVCMCACVCVCACLHVHVCLCVHVCVYVCKNYLEVSYFYVVDICILVS